MIIENGHIDVYTKSGGGIDSENNPVAPTYVIVSVPCQYQQKSRSNSGEYEGGKMTYSKYDVFVDISNKQTIESAGKFKLISNEAGDLGEFEITKADYLELVSQIKITV